MIRNVGQMDLKTGEQMDIFQVTAPEGDYGLDIVDFLHGRGPFGSDSAWFNYLHAAWRGELAADVFVSFMVGEIAGQKVGALGYNTPEGTRDVCTWGHVVTQAGQMGKGIATVLTRASIEDFRSLSNETARAMFLNTGAEGAPRHLYEKCGMRVYGVEGGGAAMWLPMGDAATFEEDYYGNPGSVTTTELRIADMARMEALMSLPYWGVKSWADNVVGQGAYEGQFHRLWKRALDGLPCRILRGSNDRVFGAAWMSNRHGGCVLDVVAHPSVVDKASGMVEEVLGTGSVRAFLSAESDDLRRRVVETAGFVKAGIRDEAVMVGGKEERVEVWVRG